MISHVKAQCVICNWTPRHTGKENVFKCSFACRHGQRVQLNDSLMRIEYVSLTVLLVC